MASGEPSDSEGSLYVHFDSKEALLLAVLAERMPGFRERLRERGMGPHRANEAIAAYLRL